MAYKELLGTFGEIWHIQIKNSFILSGIVASPSKPTAKNIFKHAEHVHLCLGVWISRGGSVTKKAAPSSVVYRCLPSSSYVQKYQVICRYLFDQKVPSYESNTQYVVIGQDI